MAAHKGLLDHKEVRIFVGPRRIQDLADGTYFTCQQTSDDAVIEEGVNGATTVIKTGASHWEGTLTVMASSPFNAYLDALRLAWVNTPGGIAIPFGLSHKVTNLITASAIIKRPPTITYSKTSAGSKEWAFLLPGFAGAIGGFELDTEAPIPESVFAALA